MQRIGSTLRFSAGDLVGHLNCRYLTPLDVKVALGELSKPRSARTLPSKLWWNAARCTSQVLSNICGGRVGQATLIEALGRCAAVAERGWPSGGDAYRSGRVAGRSWSGRADVLRRVETPSGLGAWSYQVTDTKLARETKGNTILQLMPLFGFLADMQGWNRKSPSS